MTSQPDLSATDSPVIEADDMRAEQPLPADYPAATGPAGGPDPAAGSDLTDSTSPATADEDLASDPDVIIIAGEVIQEDRDQTGSGTGLDAERDVDDDDLNEGDLDEGDLDEGDLDEGDLDEGDLADGDLADGDLAEGDLDGDSAGADAVAAEAVGTAGQLDRPQASGGLTTSGGPPSDAGVAGETGQSADLGQQWHDIQALFVDDPRGSVQLAAAAADAALSALVEALHERQAALAPAGGDAGDHGDTEQLREALRAYRIFCQSLTDMGQRLPRPAMAAH